MLRELQTILNKPASSQYKSAEDGVMTGMGVVKKSENTFGYAGTATAADVFLVDKERIPVGINASRKDMSDYEDDFVKVGNGEYAKLIAYHAGERFATDQYTGTLNAEDRLEVGADGKWVKATGVSKYVYKGEYSDNGHVLALIEVSDTAK